MIGSLKILLTQYNIAQIVQLLVYRVWYKILLAFEKTHLMIGGKNLSKTSNWRCTCIGLHKSAESNKEYHIKIADNILTCKLTIFNHMFGFNPNTDWLKCPIKGQFWDKTVFFADAPYVQKGCHDVKYILEINKMNHLVTLACAYKETSDEKYVRAIDEHLKGWLTCVPLEKSVANRIIMDLAFRCINLIQVYDLCKDSAYFRDEVLPIIIGIVSHHERQMRLFNTPKWFKTGNGDNHVTGEMVGLLCSQIWLKSITGKDYSKYYKQELKYLYEILDKTIAESGAYLEESDNYTRVVSEFLVFLDMCIRTFDSQNKLFKEYQSRKYLERLLSYLKSISYNNMLPNVGDNDNARVLVSMNKDYGVDYVTSYLSSIQLLYEYRGTYEDAGHYSYKSDDGNIFLFTRAGALSVFREGAGTHAHNDLMSVVISVKGQRLFVDKGCSFYNQGKELRNECKSGKSHNAPFIDDLEMADITPRGYVRYPDCKANVVDCTGDSYELNCSLFYKGLTVNRSISYKDNIITLTDSFDDKHRSGVTSFLLDKDVAVVSVSLDSVELALSDGSKVIVSFDGITYLSVENDRYYPRFAEKSDCKKIVISYRTDQIIKTKINI